MLCKESGMRKDGNYFWQNRNVDYIDTLVKKFDWSEYNNLIIFTFIYLRQLNMYK